jgi:hypothetical protein
LSTKICLASRTYLGAVAMHKSQALPSPSM